MIKTAPSSRSKRRSRYDSTGALNPARLYSPLPGLPNGYFLWAEGATPLAEGVRALLLCKAGLYDGGYVLEIGCGSGSVTVEAALHVTGNGLVTAIERDKKAAEIAGKNLERFDFQSYASVICGDALDVMRKDEYIQQVYSSVIISGTGDDASEIVRQSSDLLLPGGRMVVNTEREETVHAALDVMGGLGWADVDMTEVTVRGKRTPDGPMDTAQNPVTILAAVRPGS